MRRTLAASAAGILLVAACTNDSEPDPASGDLAGATLVTTLAESDLELARHVLADGEGGLWIVLAEESGPGGALVHVLDGRVDGDRSLDTAPDGEPRFGYPTEFAAATPDGAVVLTDRPGGDVWVVGVEDGDYRRRITGAPRVGGLAVADDGTILVVDQADEEVVGYTTGGTTVVVAGTDPEAVIRLSQPLDVPVSLAALPGDRIAVITDFAGIRSLRVLGPGGTGESMLTGEGDEMLGPVVATGDGRLLVIQPGQRVTLVDPDQRGERRTVLDGEGETLTSVAAVGDDLFVLHAGRLWRVEGALAG
ncbi:MAG: hypothetical protein ACRD0U_18240 [Acidimicrobiales bacterium]